MTHTPEDIKTTLHRYLRARRAGLLAKLDGLGEYDLRRPMTRSGTNLLGLVKHVASVQAEYFGLVFDRPFGHPMPWGAPDAEENADLWVPETESVQSILELHHASAAHSDATIDALDLDAPGVVPWWKPETRNVTLQQVLVHVDLETAHHAGHADIVRELIDGSIGYTAGPPNLPAFDDARWSAYRGRIEDAARAAAAAAGEGVHE
ncbi:DinB family protein [Arthrobacter woluwensis]|uniref:DinB family protein n=1 Tax=Arthrobacter woluwensis TaxID=156980 RepID=UPI000D115402|nr:DinB family protein [Arthrobacter woluwensis]PSS43182.1 DinB family protein [Arthrobacter woluwensis]